MTLSRSGNGLISPIPTLNVLRQYFLFILLVVTFAVPAASQSSSGSTKAEILAFDLLPIANSTRPGSIRLSLGPENGGNNQHVNLLAAFYTASEATMEVPTAELCTAQSLSGWNPISQPATGTVIVVGTNESDTRDVLGNGTGTLVVKWFPASSSSGVDTDVVGLTLRKGRGAQAKNVTVIAKNLQNDGEYPWDAAQTFHDEGLKNGSDYTLMLWSDSPPRQSVSEYFTMRTTLGNGKDEVTSTAPSAAGLKDCLAYMASNGGYYNQSLDPAFQKTDWYQDSFDDAYTGWEIVNTGAGSTTLSFEAQGESSAVSSVYFNGTNMDLISSSTLGMGMFSLSMLQAARNATVIEMNVIALNLGTDTQTGSVVLGGYDDALIDKDQRAVFVKSSDLQHAFHASMTKLIVDGDAETTILDDTWNNAADVLLTYDDFGLCLSQALIDSLLPLIGNPSFDEDVNGYVYDGEPNTDYTLTFGLHNGTTEVMIEVPASALIVTQSSEDNPMTTRNETGKTYLQIRPTSDGSTTGQYLGRSFLQYVYIIDSPSTINKFHLSAVRESSEKQLIAASKSSISIFDGTVSSSSTGYRLGPMIGGIVGGIGFLAVAAIGCFWFIRRRNRRNGSLSGHRSINITNNGSAAFEKETGLGHIVHHHRGKEMRGGEVGTEHSGSIRTTATIPIRYVPSFEKEIGLGYRYSSSHHPDIPRAVQSQPVMLFETPSSSASTHSSSFDYHPQDLEIPQLRDSRLSITLSEIQRRNSEVSTVAREYNTGSSEPEPESHDIVIPDQPAPLLYRSATVGRMYKAGKVKSVEGLPHSPRSRSGSKSSTSDKRSHARTASLGRVVTPVEVDLGSGSRRSSTRNSGSSAGRKSRSGSSESASSGRTGSLEELCEAHEPEPETNHHPQSSVSSDIDRGSGTHLRRLTTHTRSSGALLSPRDTLGLPRPPYTESTNHSDSRASTRILSESIRSEQEVNYTHFGLESTPHSRSGSSDSSNQGLGERRSEEEVFGLGAVRGEYQPPNDAWLVSGSEGDGSSGEKVIRPDNFLNSGSRSRSSRNDGR